MSVETSSVPQPQPTVPAPTAACAARPWWRRMISPDNRYLAPVLVTCILLGGELTYGILESRWATGLAIATAIFMELILGRLVTGKWPHLASAYISGISVGILIRSPDLWPYALCSALAIASKYAIRVRGRHIWNPSNLSVSVMLFTLPWYVAGLSVQWSNEFWPMLVIWCLGVFTLYRIGRLHITLSYVASFVILAYVRSVITEDKFFTEVAPLTGPMYQLYIFFMITDPKTTTHSTWSRCLVAVLVALVEFVLRLNQVFLHSQARDAQLLAALYAPFFALFIVGPIANLLEIWWDARHTRPAKPQKTG